MSDKRAEALARVAELRKAYGPFVERVEAELAAERKRRLAAAQADIRRAVAEAFAYGAAKRAIMRAYDTTDFKTVNDILQAEQFTVDMIRREIEEAPTAEPTSPGWFVVHPDNGTVTIHGRQFAYVELDEGEFILDGKDLEARVLEVDDIVLDGYVLSADTPGRRLQELRRALMEVTR